MHNEAEKENQLPVGIGDAAERPVMMSKEDAIIGDEHIDIPINALFADDWQGFDPGGSAGSKGHFVELPSP